MVFDSLVIVTYPIGLPGIFRVDTAFKDSITGFYPKLITYYDSLYRIINLREFIGENELGIKEGKGDMEGKDENDCSNSSSSSYFTSTSPLLAFCTGTGRLYFWSKKEGKVEGDIKWSDTVSPSPSSTSLSTSFDTSVNSLTAPGNLSSSTSNQKTMSTYYICI